MSSPRERLVVALQMARGRLAACSDRDREARELVVQALDRALHDMDTRETYAVRPSLRGAA